MNDLAHNPVHVMGMCRQVIIGAVNGAAVTGGFELALACDILVGSEYAKFKDTHVLVGVVPCWGLSQKVCVCVCMCSLRHTLADLPRLLLLHNS